MQCAAAAWAVIARGSRLHALVPGRAQLVRRAGAAVVPATLPLHPDPIECIVVATAGVGDTQMCHHGTPLRTMRAGASMTGGSDQVGDFVCDRTGKKIAFVTACDFQVVA